MPAENNESPPTPTLSRSFTTQSRRKRSSVRRIQEKQRTIYELCHAPVTVTSEAAKNPTLAPDKIADKLYSKQNRAKFSDSSPSIDIKDEDIELSSAVPSQADLDFASQCGQFPTRPSDLFLNIYHECLLTLESDPFVGMVSPPLLGSSGVVPLSIISVIPDIVRHMADVIVHAEKEVFLATNYWENSHASKTICDALRELSRRVGERGGDKVVVKVMYDRGTPKQVIENHVKVPEVTYTEKTVNLPPSSEIPNLTMEVLNYHRPPLGTFHAKFMIADRRIALLMSNNIQDRVNLEMMTHLEGSIVNSFYDMALLSWNKEMDPALPCLVNPPPPQTKFDFGDEHKFVQMKDLALAKENAREFLRENQEYAEEDKAPDGSPIGHQHDSDNSSEPPIISTSHAPASSSDVPSLVHLNSQPPASGTDGTADSDITAEASAVQRALEQSAISPPLSTTSSTMNGSESQRKSRIAAITARLNTTLQDTVGNVPDLDDAEEFRPHIIHTKHDPVPIAMVNRKPRGTPGHSGINNPQDRAWLAALKYAQRKVFIQTPTFNASQVVQATMAALRRGVEVILFLDLGFNDAGEMLPFQGGTNEQVVEKMYKELEGEHKQNLKVYWYTGKDQSRPINASAKKRNCHIKLMTVDDSVGIQGNGNQDAQSWYHSQEINVMIDSPLIISEWQDGIRANQNTHLHGKTEIDGVWRDKDGNPLADAPGGKRTPWDSIKGIAGAFARVRGTGGF